MGQARRPDISLSSDRKIDQIQYSMLVDEYRARTDNNPDDPASDEETSEGSDVGVDSKIISLMLIAGLSCLLFAAVPVIVVYVFTFVK